MPALNFQARFADAVESGEKCQTIRAHRKDKRDPKVGDTLYLYTGMRTKACRKLREVKCEKAVSVFIKPGSIFVADIVDPAGEAVYRLAPKASFAKADGFVDWESMREWFDKTHGLPFKGLLIGWKKI